MAAFNFIALDRDGKQVRGLTEAESAKQARRALRERGLNPVDVAESDAPAGKDAAPQRSPRRLSGDDRILFTRLLATLLDSGLPLDDAYAKAIRWKKAWAFSPRLFRKIMPRRSVPVSRHVICH